MSSYNFQVNGVKRELGQTLSSTGLTIWRAAEHLCEYMVNQPQRFMNRKSCELGTVLKRLDLPSFINNVLFVPLNIFIIYS